MKSIRKWLDNKTVRYVLVGIAALVLLLLLWKTFGATGESASTDYQPTAQEARIVRLLSSVDGVDDATVLISEADGEAVGAVVVFRGTDSILVRMRILDITSAALNIEKQNVQVYAAS